MQYHVIPYNTMQFYAIQCNAMLYHVIPCIINNCWRSVPLPCGQYNGHFCHCKDTLSTTFPLSLPSTFSNLNFILMPLNSNSRSVLLSGCIMSMSNKVGVWALSNSLMRHTTIHLNCFLPWHCKYIQKQLQILDLGIQRFYLNIFLYPPHSLLMKMIVVKLV